MRLALDSDPRINLVRRYGNGELLIGAQLITRPCIVSPERLQLDWAVSSFEQLCSLAEAALSGAIEPLLSLHAGIVLIGAGASQPLPGSALRAAFQRRAIALECMNLGAACRTYNILANEQRPVVAALFP